MLSRTFTLWILWTFCGVLASADAIQGDDKKPEKKTSEPCVEIDFSTLPEFTEKGDLTYHFEFVGVVTEPNTYTGPVYREDMALIYYQNLKTAGVKVERVGDTKVRVYGWKDKEGVFHPVIKGTVTSKTIKPEQLPKVTNPKNKG
ncbi:MAG: hypothetical protein L0241_28795 [Planctomycetia bacterium]|nr:hypothetical protein [Planctomycetia bacterium]